MADKERECIWCGEKFFPTSDDPDAGHCSIECFESEQLSHSDPEPMEIELEEKMSNPNYLFILGASDPEMAAIENLLSECGQKHIKAIVDGQRVHPGNAYRYVISQERVNEAGFAETMVGGDVLIFVECGADPLPLNSIRVDHHRPGDYGYGMPPEEYWDASSLGQIYRLLNQMNYYKRGRQIDLDKYNLDWQELRFVAAADHCLAAAYRGQCPGVDPQALRIWRVKSRAKFQNCSTASLFAVIELAEAALRAAPRIIIGSVEIADLRGPVIPELPEAATYLGLDYLAEVVDRDGRKKIVISAGENTLREFMNSWAQSQGLTDIYGDPIRGFAGAYKEKI